MRKPLLINLAALAMTMAGPALAADLPVKAAPFVERFSWTGCYVGAHVGGAFAQKDITDPVTGVALTPNSNGFTAEIAYMPFAASKSFGWPWFNARIGLQYTYYNKLKGTTVGAQDNNTLFLHAWVAF